MTAGRRYFLALQPDPAVRAALAAIRLPSGARRVLEPDLHLTVAYLGTLEAPSPQALLATLAPALVGPVAVELDAVEYWAGPRAACAVGHSPQAEALASALWPLLQRLGYPGPDHPLRTHVTLARGLGRHALDGSSLAPALAWTSRQLVLMASAALAAVGAPRYRTLAAAALG